MMSEEEIEYLDEDAEIVQQCVQKSTDNQFVETKPTTPLLVERQPASKKKKRKTEEDDSDYDPRDDMVPPPSNRNKKRKLIPPQGTPKPSSSIPLQILPLRSPKKPVLVSAIPKNRRTMKIGIPDYDDPLCMPVRAIMRTSNDVKKLKAWNNACLSHLKHADKLLKPEKGVTKGSTRTVVLRNFLNRETCKYETAVWSKTSVVNDNGVTKSQNFQSILPKFSEKTFVKINAVTKPTKSKKYHRVDEVILTRENYKNEESLVVYKPMECLSAVYQMIPQKDSKDTKEGNEIRKYLREVTCTAMCCVCYQLSWRGVGGKEDGRKNVRCPVCSRTFVSLYNLLTHARSHSSEEVRKHKTQLVALLAKMVSYHYMCRICKKQQPSIAKLKQHVAEHKGNEKFVCEVGNHVTS